MHVVSGKLRKPPFTKDGCGADGQSKMYVVELAEMIKDWQTQEKTYTNYKAMFFAKTDQAKQFYDHAFAEGAFVVVTAEKLKAETFQADSGVTYVTLMMDNAKLESCMPVESLSGQQQQKQQQGWGQPQQPSPQNQQQQQQAQPQYNEPPSNFDDSEIPF